MTSWIPTVKKIIDGSAVEAAVVNTSLDQLIQRDQYLYDRLLEYLNSSSLVAFEQPIHPSEIPTYITDGKLNLVYYRKDDAGEGVSRAITGFTSTQSSSMYTPKNSNYSLGIVHSVTAQNTANVFISGLCTLPVAIDDSSYGLLEPGQTFKVGPYYVSRVYPGKLTSDPAGIPSYVGYAVSKYKFLLNPSVEEFSQFFINYRYNILDKPAAQPTLSDGVWTLSTSNNSANVLGWISVDSPLLEGYVVPEEAKYFYYIPINPGTDEQLTEAEVTEATELSGVLPPIPSNFIQFSVNGVIQAYRDSHYTDGLYTTDQYGLWWFDDTDGNQPWLSTATASNWSQIKSTNSIYRPRMFVSCSKFNPALRTQLVSSITAYNDSDNNSAEFISFYNNSDKSIEASTGDIAVKVNPQFVDKGFSDTTEFAFPGVTTESYTSDRAIANLKFNQVTGKFERVMTPVVSKLTGLGNIKVNEVTGTPGAYTISQNSVGQTGVLDSMEPINSRLEFMGLHSYIRLPFSNPVTTPYGLIGKIVLPKDFPTGYGVALNIHWFGFITSSSTTNNVYFNFDYSTSTSANTDNTLTGNQIISQSTNINSNPVILDISSGSGAYTTSNKVYKVMDTEKLVIPSSYITEDTIVNFRLLRALPQGASSPYAGDIGILDIYWTLV